MTRFALVFKGGYWSSRRLVVRGHAASMLAQLDGGRDCDALVVAVLRGDGHMVSVVPDLRGI